MTEPRVELRRNANTGKTDLVIHINAPVHSAGHEAMHRELVELIATGVKPEDLGELIVDRQSR
jgi:hypothetical protein